MFYVGAISQNILKYIHVKPMHRKWNDCVASDQEYVYVALQRGKKFETNPSVGNKCLITQVQLSYGALIAH